MLFNSLRFILFFPVVCMLYFILPTTKIRNIWLLFASYVFYMSWSAKHGILLLAVTVVSYGAALLMNATKGSKRKAIMILALLAEFSLLFVFKYFNFLFALLEGFLKIDLEFSVSLALPVGISFYIFQTGSYVIDVYRGETETETNFLNYALYVSFFPQLVAGPIERSKNFLMQFRENHVFCYPKVKSGFLLMIWGYFVKIVIADRAAFVVDTVYGNPEKYTCIALVFATFLFGVQLYCDFAGYSLIALGASEIMGFRMTDNFRAPYLSQSISEFWRRWHISLYEWFKSYLYIPLGGSRKGKFRKYVNVLIVCTVSGLWHGANLTFVIWGFLNGAYQVVGGLKKELLARFPFAQGCPSWLVHIYKSSCVCILYGFTLIFFRANQVDVAWLIIRKIFTLTEGVGTVRELLLLGCNLPNLVVLILTIFVLLISDIMKDRGIVLRERILRENAIVQGAVILLSVLTILVFGIYGNDSGSFIYFVF